MEMKVLFLFINFIFVWGIGFGLYEDQIGKFDWKKEFIGKVKFVDFERSISASKHLFATSDRNVVACLNARNGDIVWRRVLGGDQGTVVKMFHHREGLVTVNDNGVTRSWNGGNGALKWETDIATSDDFEKELIVYDATILEQSYSSGNFLVILSSVGIHLVSLQQRNPKVATFMFDHDPGVRENNKLLINSASSEILHLKLEAGTQLSLSVLDKNLDLTSSLTLDTPWLDDFRMTAILENSILVYFHPDVSRIFVVDLLNDVTKQYEAADLKVHGSITAVHSNQNEDVKMRGEDFLVSHDGDKLSQLRVTSDLLVEKLWTKVVGVEPLVSLRQINDQNFAFLSTQQDSQLTVAAVDLKTGLADDSLTISYKIPQSVGRMENIFINCFLKRSSIGFRALLLTHDESLILLTHPNRAAWQRDEGLASVSKSFMLDLPLSDSNIELSEEKVKVIDLFLKRLKAQAAQLGQFVKQTFKELDEGVLFEDKTRDPLIQVEGLVRDPFSLHKMIVAATTSGSVFGIDSLTGDIVWRYFSPLLKNKKLELFLQRSTNHFPHPPQGVLLALDSKQPLVVLEFNPITGSFIDHSDEFKHVASKVLQASLLPTLDSDHLRPLVVMDKSLKVHLLPDTTESRKALESLKMFLFDGNPENGVIRGFTLGGSTATLAWNVNIPASHKIVRIEGKLTHEKVDSVGRPLADRSVIYKYLNPNVVAVVSESVETEIEKSSLLCHLVDAVTGEIVHSVVLKKASGPIHVIHSENWLLFSYWNKKARRTEVTSLEMYEGKQQTNNTAFSSFQHRSPVVMQQSYILPAGVSSMGVSRTEKGITSRQVLFGLNRGVVFGLPRKFFDPRRPLHITDSTKEESLIPYMPEIPIPPEMFLSYNQTISEINLIVTSPSALESTSLVFVSGLDLFFTRTQPSKLFDVLKEDFDHFFIFIVLVAMLVAALVTRKMSQQKQLYRSWK